MVRMRVKSKIRIGGFTLSEVLIAAATATIILGAVVAFTLFSGKSFVGLSNYMSLQTRNRQALDILTRDIRNSVALLEYATNRIVLQRFDGQRITIYWNPQTGVVTRSVSGQEQVLLTDCDYLLFRIYQRNPLPGKYDFYPATNLNGAYDPLLCKLIDITWRCSKPVLGQKLQSESILTAKIVLRN